MNRDLNIKSTIRQILGVLISIMILMPFTVSSQTVTTTIDCANATTDINGNGYRWDLSNKILALDGIDLRTSQMMGIELPPNSTKLPHVLFLIMISFYNISVKRSFDIGTLKDSGST